MTDTVSPTAVVERAEPYTVEMTVFNVNLGEYALFAQRAIFVKLTGAPDLSYTMLRVAWTLDSAFDQAVGAGDLSCRRSEARNVVNQILGRLAHFVGPGHAITVQLESISRLGGKFAASYALTGVDAVQSTPTLDDLTVALNEACDLHDIWVAHHGHTSNSPYLALAAQIVRQIEPLLQEEPCATP